MVGLVCVDVDGTLVGSSGLVDERVWAAAERLARSGRRLAICSGRPAFGMTRGLAERLDPEGWHAFQNGASVLHLPSDESHSRPIPADALAALIARGRETGRILEVYSDVAYAVEVDDERSRRHAALLGLPFALGDLTAFGPAVRAQWLVPHEVADAVEAEPAPGLTVTSSLSPVMPDTTFLNITPEGVNKGAALRVIAAAYGVPVEEVMMVGDGENDVSALTVAGVPVAMGNAEPEAKAVARHVVGDVDALGLVEAFELAMAL